MCPFIHLPKPNLPDGLWMQVDNLLIFDQVKRKIWAIAYADLRDPSTTLETAYQQACDRVAQLVNKLQSPLSEQAVLLEWTSPGPGARNPTLVIKTYSRAHTPHPTLLHSASHTPHPSPLYTSNTTKEQYCANVETGQSAHSSGRYFPGCHLATACGRV